MFVKCVKRHSVNRTILQDINAHSGERPYVCEMCNKAFSQQSSLIIHQCMHSGERRYVCNKAYSDQTKSGNTLTHA